MARQIVGEIFLNVKPLDAGVASGVQTIIDKASQNAAKVPVSADTAEAEQAVGRLAGTIENDIGNAWIAATAQAAAFTVAVLGVKRAAEQAVAKLAGIFDQLAQAQAGFTAILGSEQSGSQLLDDIREFARVSPFVTQQLVNYSQQLLGVGQSAESIVPLLQSVGDVVASVGGDTQNISRVLFTLTQIRSIGRLVGQDAIQLQSALIPITKILAEFLGITTQEVKKLQEQGAISADTVFAALTAAGKNVEGAMATATRNISGARSVLTDTVEIMLQDSEALRTIFDDIVVGILRFSEALGEPVIRENVDSISESIGKLYEGLQPLIEGFSQTAAVGAINALKITASALEILASAVDAMPVWSLDLIGKSLAVLLALKAPLALLQYSKALTNIGNAIRPANLAGSLQQVESRLLGTGTAAERAGKHVDELTPKMRRIGTAASVAAVGLGLLFQNMDEGNGALEKLGSSLTGAGIGAQLGSAFGPKGLIAGAALGGGAALITSFVTGAREEAKRKAADLEEVASQTAEAFMRQFELANPAGFTTGQTFDDLFTGLEDQFGDLDAQAETIRITEANLRTLIDTYDELQSGLALVGESEAEARLNRAEGVLDEIIAVQDDLQKVKTDFEANTAAFDKVISEGGGAEALEMLRDRLSSLARESPEFTAAMQKAFSVESDGGFGTLGNLSEVVAGMYDFNVATGQIEITSGASLSTIKEGLELVGLSIDSLTTVDIPLLVARLSDDMPNAAKETEIALREMKTAFDEAKKSMEEFYNSFQLQVDSAKTMREESEGLQKAFTEIRDTGQLGGFAEQLLKNVQSISTAAQAAYDDPAKGIASGLSFAKAAFEELQADLRVTDDEFKNLLDTVGLLDLYMSTSDVESGFAGNIIRLSRETGIAESELRDLLNLQDDLARTTELTVTADTLDALTKLSTIRDQLENLPVGEQRAEVQRLIEEIDYIIGLAGGVRITGASPRGSGPEGSPLQPGDLNRLDATVGATIRAQNEKARQEAERLAEEQRREAERLAREAERLAAEQQREAERILAEQERYVQSLQSAGETVAQSIQSASDNIKAAAEAWTASIKERTRQEQAVPIERLLRNAEQQANDLSFIDSGLQQLAARGLSEDAINAVGISGLGDVRQLSRLLGSSDAQLQQLSGLVGQRDANAEAIARRQQREETQATIVAAIIQAAGILGIEGITPDRASQLAAQFVINGQPIPAEQLPQDLVGQLLNIGGQIART